MDKSFAIEAKAFYSKSYDEVKFINKGIFLVNEYGFIESVYEKSQSSYDKIRKKLLEEGKLRILAEDEYILPGFIDLHNHAPQWPQSGTALDSPLEVWLGKYTFPLESKYKDLEFANKVYRDLVRETLKFGTTTAMYFASVDRAPSTLLAKICGSYGQRGLIGKVVMDDPDANTDYCRDKSAKDAIEETKLFIDEILAIKDSYKQRVYPVITPRFIPSCSDEALKGLGELAKTYKDIHIQSHVSESDWEHSYAIERYGIHDAKALDKFGLINERTVLAHACHLSEDDMKLLAGRGASIAHSPISNAYFANAVLPVKTCHENCLNVGLATDISGGYSPSLYTAIRQAVISSRMLNDGVDPALGSDIRGRKDSAITLNRAFYLATAGGGQALKLPIGKLEKDYAFDIQILKIDNTIPHFYDEISDIDILHKLLLLSESSNIKEVYVQGERVK